MFNGCNFDIVNFDKAEKIGCNSFVNCNFNCSVTLKNVTVIEALAFCCPEFTQIEFGNSLLEIGAKAFENIVIINDKAINIPSSVIIFNDNAFSFDVKLSPFTEVVHADLR